MVERTLDAVHRPCHTLLARDLGPPLSAQRAAVARPHADAEIDRALLALDLPRAFARVRMGEVWRETQHRARLPGLARRRDSRRDLGVAVHEPVVVLDALTAQPRRVANPLHVVARPGNEVVKPALGKDTDARKRHASLEHDSEPEFRPV